MIDDFGGKLTPDEIAKLQGLALEVRLCRQLRKDHKVLTRTCTRLQARNSYLRVEVKRLEAGGEPDLSKLLTETRVDENEFVVEGREIPYEEEEIIL